MTRATITIDAEDEVTAHALGSAIVNLLRTNAGSWTYLAQHAPDGAMRLAELPQFRGADITVKVTKPLLR